MTKKLLMGNEAFAHAALEAGVNVVAGYPGTPSSEVIETIARLQSSGKAKDVYVEWSTNEAAALEVCAAASMSGARALFTCKQVGLNVASDALMSLNYVGVRGGLVLLVADDPGPISSQTEQDTRRFAAFAKVPVLDPSTPEQGFEMMKAAFELSEAFQTPVILRPTTRIDHASTFFEVNKKTKARPIPNGGFQRNPDEWVIFPKRSYRAHGEIIKRLQSITHRFMYDPAFARFNPAFERSSLMTQHSHANGIGAHNPNLSGQNPSTRSAMDVVSEPGYSSGSTPTLGIMVGGISTQYALDALDLIAIEATRAGVEVPSFRFMQIGTPYPFPRRAVSRFLKDLSDVLVLEELDSVIEEELLKVAGNSFLSPNIHGKLTGEANERGENSTEDAAFRIAYFFDTYRKGVPNPALRGTGNHQQPQRIPSLEALIELAIGPNSLISYDAEIAPRPPILCAGCPHRGSFYAMKAALKKLKIPREDAIFCGDIGCYTLGNAMPLDAVDTCLCMGAGISMAQGFAIANAGKKCLAFVGDSTFFASAMTGIANAVYNQHDITICVLDNSTTAMTGSQPHPGTGQTLMGGQSQPINIREVLVALGVNNVYETDPLNKKAAQAVCERALEESEPNAIIFKSECVWLKPFDNPAKVHVNLCTGCRKCITEIGCPAIGFDPEARGAKSNNRGVAFIDESQCNGCGLCLQVCPFHAIDIVTPEELELYESAKRASEGNTGVAHDFGASDSTNASAISAEYSDSSAKVDEVDAVDRSRGNISNYPKRTGEPSSQMQIDYSTVQGDFSEGEYLENGELYGAASVAGELGQPVHQDLGDTVFDPEVVYEPSQLDASVLAQDYSGMQADLYQAQFADAQTNAMAYDQYAQDVSAYYDPTQMATYNAPQEIAAGYEVPNQGISPGDPFSTQSAENVFHYSIKQTGASQLLRRNRSQNVNITLEDDLTSEETFVDEELDLFNDEDELEVLAALENHVFLELESDEDEDDEEAVDTQSIASETSKTVEASNMAQVEEVDEDFEAKRRAFQRASYGTGSTPPVVEPKKNDVPSYKQSRWGGRG